MIRELFEQKPQLKKIILYVLLAIVAIIVISLVFSSFKTTKLTYKELEEKMAKAAENYYKSNPDKLPGENDIVNVSADTLVNANEMKSLDRYLQNGKACSGKVVVRNSNNNYSYTAYLDCGSDYTTMEFYNKILSDHNIVTSGDGLYVQGDSKIFRGEKLNNFVSDGTNLWRIVKIDSDNSVKLILYGGKIKSMFDDRYNSEKESAIGKNTYNISRLKEISDTLYNNSYSEVPFLSDNIKSKLISKSLCVGKRAENGTVNDGSVECSETLDGEYIGHLSLFEYINASLDSKCSSATTDECQNYNYLSDDLVGNSWWLITPTIDNTYQVYYVNSNGSIGLGKCSMNLTIRPTINLSMETIYVSGTGTEEDPYLIK